MRHLQEEMERRSLPTSGVGWRVLVFAAYIVLLTGAALVFVFVFKQAQAPPAMLEAAPPATGPRRMGPPAVPATGPTTAPTTATAPASRPATAPATKKWTPPRFTARRRARDAMVRTIRRYGLTDSAVLAAMTAVPRHEFVPRLRLSAAYDDNPLPIGYGQTISQPYIVAEMTRQLQLKPTSRVLEIGTGSGYQAAVLTEFTPHVYSIEIVEPLATSAAERLKRLGYDVVRARHGDGYYGWKGQENFDAIIVTCAAGQIPPPLVRQLAPGGRMVIPVGSPFAVQSLMLVTKDSTGRVHSRSLMGVRFVPLTHGDAPAK